MANRSCTTCVYAYWDRCQWMTSLSSGFPSRPICANHPDSLGRLRPVPSGEVCRNYRPRPAEPEKAARRIPLSDGLMPTWTPPTMNGSASGPGMWRVGTLSDTRRAGGSTCTARSHSHVRGRLSTIPIATRWTIPG